VSHILNVRAAKAFENISPGSPLNELYERDRAYLCALLFLYAWLTTELRKGKTADDTVEKVSKVVADAATYAAKLELELFRGPHSDVLRPFSAKYEDLPERLVRLSEELGTLLDSVGKRGHKQRVFATQFLVEASEFVRLRTGQHYDEYLAELFQSVAEGLRPLSEDLSGDAIRKNREYAKRNYPEFCAQALERARTAFKGSERMYAG